MAGHAPLRPEFVGRLRRSVIPFPDCAARNGRNPHARKHVGNRLRIASAFSLPASAARAAPDLARVVEDNRRLWQRRRQLNAPLQLGTIPRILTIFKRMMSNALREPAAQGTETGTGAVRGIPASPGTA